MWTSRSFADCMQTRLECCHDLCVFASSNYTHTALGKVLSWPVSRHNWAWPADPVHTIHTHCTVHYGVHCVCTQIWAGWQLCEDVHTYEGFELVWAKMTANLGTLERMRYKIFGLIFLSSANQFISNGPICQFFNFCLWLCLHVFQFFC